MKKLSKVYMALVLAFLYLPILVLIIFSFNASKSRSVFTGFTLDWYQKLFIPRQHHHHCGGGVRGLHHFGNRGGHWDQQASEGA